ncbi:MAG: YraN family protein [Clostridia bacterium]|nr:YraN family protein [Clostridia bacterium]
MEILKIKTKKRRIGDLGEKIAAKHLKKQGYKILEKNFVAEGCEIDIIASFGEVVAFVEVKTRSFKEDTLISPSAAVTPEKQRKIIKTAKCYAAYHAHGKILRLDVIEIILDGNKAKEINHIENAFNYNSAHRG